MEKYENAYRSLLSLFLLLSLLIGCLFFVNVVDAADVVIDNSTSDGIKGSINNGNDTVTLNNGTYTGSNNTNITINSGRNITIGSSDPNNKAIIDCEGSWFITNNGNLTLVNLIIKNAYRLGDGGAIYNTGTLTIINCTFINNTATRGGTIYNTANNMVIINSSFINNSAMNVSGGAIDNSGTNVTINNSNFTNNKANTTGGAISNYGNNMVIMNSSFINNSATTSNGGAIYNFGGSNIIVNNSSFIDNKANIHGGAISNFYGNNMVIMNSSFINNSATTGNGGTIYNTVSSNIIVNNSSFIDNKANRGGVIFNSNSFNMSVVDSIFINNSATINGGAIQNDNSNSMVIMNSSFVNNSASNAGAVYNNGANVIINGSSFINNSASNAGSIYNSGLNLTIDNSSFIDNLANSSGVIDNVGNNMIINNSNFINNSATNFGGVIFNSGFNMVINNSSFINNSATNSGGAIHNNGFNVSIMDSSFINNSASNGGAVYNTGANVIINGSGFVNNSASNGSAVYNSGGLSSIDNSYNQVNGKYIIYNNQYGVLFLDNNIMVSNHFEKIYNLGLINSTVYVFYLNNKTVIVVIGERIVLNATLTDDMGNCIVGQNVTFVVESLSNSTDVDIFSNGYYYLNFTVNQLGSYFVNGTYRGGNNLTILNGIIKVVKIPTNNQVNIPNEIIVGDNITIESILTDKYGNPLANQTIDFYINDKYVGSAVTDVNGVARFNYIFNKSGNYQVYTVFNETSTYYGSNATNITVVVKIPTITEIIVDGDKITAILKDKDGNLLEGKEIIFTINGIAIGSGITDANGQVIIYYKDAYKYKITASFSGDNKYYASNDIHTPSPNPTPTPTPNPDPSPINPVDPENNIISGKAKMKKTGISTITVLLLLLSSLGFFVRKK